MASIWTHSVSQMQAFFYGVESLRTLSKLKREGKIRLNMFTSSIKRHIWRFHVVVVQ